MQTRPRNPRRRYNKKGQKKARMLRAPQAKKYTYDFNLLPQMLVIDPVTGAVSISVSTGAGQKPLVPLSVPAQLAQYSSATGFANVADIALASSFKVSDIGNFSNYQIMYDAYKINSITMTIQYLNNSAEVGQTGLMPTLYVYNDQDDVVLPTNLLGLVGKTGFKSFQFGNGGKTKFSYKWRPTNTVGLQSSSGGGGLVNSSIVKSGWINCANVGQNVEHYGLKMWIADLSTFQTVTGASSGFRISWKYNVSFRSPIMAA